MTFANHCSTLLIGLVFQYRTITSTRADEAVQLHKEMLTNCDGQPTLRDFILFLNVSP